MTKNKRIKVTVESIVFGVVDVNKDTPITISLSFPHWRNMYVTIIVRLSVLSICTFDYHNAIISTGEPILH